MKYIIRSIAMFVCSVLWTIVYWKSPCSDEASNFMRKVSIEQGNFALISFIAGPWLIVFLSFILFGLYFILHGNKNVG